MEFLFSYSLLTSLHDISNGSGHKNAKGIKSINLTQIENPLEIIYLRNVKQRVSILRSYAIPSSIDFPRDFYFISLFLGIFAEWQIYRHVKKLHIEIFQLISEGLPTHCVQLFLLLIKTTFSGFLHVFRKDDAEQSQLASSQNVSDSRL